MSMTLRGREYEIWTGGNPQTYQRAGQGVPHYISRVASPYGTVFVVMLEQQIALLTSLQEAIRTLDAWEAGRPTESSPGATLPAVIAATAAIREAESALIAGASRP